jgi:hypothetical protein
MAEAVPFTPVKLICGIIASQADVFSRSTAHLIELFGPADHSSELLEFKFTDYYEKQMGGGLKRKFISFHELTAPEILSEAKIQTNALELVIKEEIGSSKRAVNLDPGYLTASALILATVKDFSHRIPLQKGIYAHLEFLFGKNDVRTLDWTYPDYRTKGYQRFFLEVRKTYLQQLKVLRI